MIISKKPRKINWQKQKAQTSLFGEIDRYLLHNEGQPAFEYDDGWKHYYFENARLPEKYGAIHPNLWKAEWIDQEQNADVRTTLLKGIGYERWLAETGGEVIHEDVIEFPIYRFEDGSPLQAGEKLIPMPENPVMMHGDVLLIVKEIKDTHIIDTGGVLNIDYQLIQRHDPSIGKMLFLKMKNPSVPGLFHVEPVQPLNWIKTCQDALQWRWHKDLENESNKTALWVA